MNVKISYQRLICNMWYDIFQVVVVVGILEEFVSKVKQSRSEKKVRKVMFKFGKVLFVYQVDKGMIDVC